MVNVFILDIDHAFLDQKERIPPLGALYWKVLVKLIKAIRVCNIIRKDICYLTSMYILYPLRTLY